MPPKKTGKKTQDKVKAKIIEDKTFGLKNKNKSNKVQRYVQDVKKQVETRGMPKRGEMPVKSKKELEREKAAELAELFKPVAQTRVPTGIDPKSMICQFFKAGQCKKGNKCKYSHDFQVERKSGKIDLYSDRREDDTMDNWDEAKLQQVVELKAGESNKNQTEIVCKYFLEAIETKKYGWFWECPNGGDKCLYRHALPPGFVLKSKEKEEDTEEVPLEELLEQERAKLQGRGTPVTLETFMAWKERKKKQKEEARVVAEAKRAQDIKAGRALMSGREMFVYNPDLFVDDDLALEQSDLVVDESDDTATYEMPGANSEAPLYGEDGEENGDYGASASTTTTTTTTTTVAVDESLFNAEEIPEDEDEDEDEDEEGEGEEQGEEDAENVD